MPVKITPLVEIQYDKKASFDSRKHRRFQEFTMQEFTMAVNQDIKKLNKLIHEFNNTQNPDITSRLDSIAGKKPTPADTLRKIYQQLQLINNTYPLYMITQCESYQKQLHDQLFVEIQGAAESIGITSMTQLVDPEKAPDLPTTLSELIANMPHEVMQELMKILWDNIDVPKRLANLYASNDTAGEDFRQFLATHTVTILPGMGNSRNVKVEPLDGSTPPVILKVDARLGRAKSVEIALRDKNFEHLVTIHGAERQATITEGKGDPLTANLVITDFCPEGDLQSKSKKKFHDPITRMSSALHYFPQMTKIMLDLEIAGCAFPDAKNANWLIGSNGDLQLADTKSLVNLSSSGLVDYNAEENYWARGLVFTHHLIAPEMYHYDKTPFAPGPMHAYMLGKNLYQYLTCCTSDSITDAPPRSKHYFSNSDFMHPIFHTPVGQACKALIQKLVRPDPLERLLLADAKHELEKIQILHMKSTIEDSLLKIGNNCLSINHHFLGHASFSHLLKDSRLDAATRQLLIDNLDQLKNTDDLPKLLEIKTGLKNIEKLSEDKLTLSSILHKIACTSIRLEPTISQHLPLFSILVDPRLDKGMHAFVTSKIAELQLASTKEALVKIYTELTTIELLLDPISKQVDAIVKKLEQSWGVNSKAKAKLIREAFEQVPVEDRIQLFSKQTPEILAFHNALSWFRTGGKEKNTALLSTSLEDTEKRAKSYKDFKEAIKEIMKPDASSTAPRIK